MQENTIQKVTADRAKQRAKQGQELLDLMNKAEASVYRNVNLANYRAWEFGRFLTRAKHELGHGLFSHWRNATFPKVHERKSQRCQELFANNSNATVLSDFSDRSLKKWIDALNRDSVRKFRLGYVPEKFQPKHKGNIKFPRLVSFLNIANEYDRLRERHTAGLQDVDFEEAREETKELYQFLKWLHGEASRSPWEASRPSGR
jgi:hypothetical protein